MKAIVKFMNGGRIEGYYYISLEGSNFIACEKGHPDFVLKFDERGENGEKEAKRIVKIINKKLK